MMFVVYETATGRAVSFGTVIADPLPNGLTSRALSDTEAEVVRLGGGRWFASELRVVLYPGWEVIDGVVVPPILEVEQP
jgi:hypothetical protein